MGVSKNNGIPKSSILIGFSIISHPFWVFSPYFWKHPNLSHVFLMPTLHLGPRTLSSRDMKVLRSVFFFHRVSGGVGMEINQQIPGPSLKNLKKTNTPENLMDFFGLNETSVEAIIVSKDVMFFFQCLLVSFCV